MQGPRATSDATLFGHPAGLFTLFFAEMWERFSYYGMRALLLFYMLKGFLGYGDHRAYAVYGAYTALVYMTPFFGGAIADHLLGSRRAVVLGGVLMASRAPADDGGERDRVLRRARAAHRRQRLLQAEHLHDRGFAVSRAQPQARRRLHAVLHGHQSGRGDVAAAVRLHRRDLRLALRLRPGHDRHADRHRRVRRAGAPHASADRRPARSRRPARCSCSGRTTRSRSRSTCSSAVALLASAATACVALARGGLPAEAGQPKDPDKLRRRVLGPLDAERAVYAGTLVLVPVFALLVSGFAPFTANHAPVMLFSESAIAGLRSSAGAAGQILAVVVEEISKPAGLVLVVTGVGALGYMGYELMHLDRARARAHDGGAHADLLFDAVLVVLRTSRQLDQQLHRSQRRPRPRAAHAVCRRCWSHAAHRADAGADRPA